MVYGHYLPFAIYITFILLSPTMASILSFSRSASTDNKKTKGGCSVSIWVLVLSNLLVFQLTLLRDVSSSFNPSSMVTNEDLQAKYMASLPAEIFSPSNNSSGWNPHNPLAIPVGQAENLYVASAT